MHTQDVVANIENFCSLIPDKMPFNAEVTNAFVVADYGCQDSGVSMPLIRHLIGVVFWALIQYKDAILSV